MKILGIYQRVSFRYSDLLIVFIYFASIITCWAQAQRENLQFEIERFSPLLDSIVSKESNFEILGAGFDWLEGPLWIENHEMLLFSDIPKNIVYKWTERLGVELYLEPSGFTNDRKVKGGKGGSNGLLLGPNGNLVLFQQGDRRVAAMVAPLDSPNAEFKNLATNFKGKRLNSPNDGVFKSNGEIYFTDPPYGLDKGENSPFKEIAYQGVFKISGAGKVDLLLDSLTRPNGIAFLPGEYGLLIANSDPAKPFVCSYELDRKGGLTNGRIFHDFSGDIKAGEGLPDGIKVDKNGNAFVTGPGGVWIFSASGERLGRIKINSLVSNCAFSPQETTLFVTADDLLLKINLR